MRPCRPWLSQGCSSAPGRAGSPGRSCPRASPGPPRIAAGTIAAAADRAPVLGADFAALLPDVARRLLGDHPPRARGDEWRYGSHGSLAVHPERGTWHDFEADAGGGTLALIEHVLTTDHGGALAWLVEARLIDPPTGPGRTPAAPPACQTVTTSTVARAAAAPPKPAPTADVVAPPAPKPSATARPGRRGAG